MIEYYKIRKLIFLTQELITITIYSCSYFLLSGISLYLILGFEDVNSIYGRTLSKAFLGTQFIFHYLIL